MYVSLDGMWKLNVKFNKSDFNKKKFPGKKHIHTHTHKFLYITHTGLSRSAKSRALNRKKQERQKLSNFIVFQRNWASKKDIFR